MDEEYNHRLNIVLGESSNHNGPSRISAESRQYVRKTPRKTHTRIRDLSTPKKIAHNIETTNSSTPLLDKFFEKFPIPAFQKENQDINMLANISHLKTLKEINLTTNMKKTSQTTISEKMEHTMKFGVNTSSAENVSEPETEHDTVLDVPFIPYQINQTPRTKPRSPGGSKRKRLEESMIIKKNNSRKDNQWEHSSKLQIEEDAHYPNQNSCILDNTKNDFSQNKLFEPEFGKCSEIPLEKSSNDFLSTSQKSSSSISSSSPQLDVGQKSDKLDFLQETQNTPEAQCKYHNSTTEASALKLATSTLNRNANSGLGGKSALTVGSVKRLKSSSKDITNMHFKKSTKCKTNKFKHMFTTGKSPSLSREQKCSFQKANCMKKRLIFENKEVNNLEAFQEFENNPAGKILSISESAQHQATKFSEESDYNSKQSLQQQNCNKSSANRFEHTFITENSPSFSEEQHCNFQKVGHVKRRLFIEDKEVNKSNNFCTSENYLAGKSVPSNKSKQDRALAKVASANTFENINSAETNNTQNFVIQNICYPNYNNISDHFSKFHKVANCPVKSKEAATCVPNSDIHNWPLKFDQTAAFLRNALQGNTEPSSSKVASSEIQPIEHCNIYKEIDQTAHPNKSDITAREMANDATTSQMSQITQKTLFSSEGYETMSNSQNLSNKLSDNPGTQNCFRVNQFVDYYATKCLKNANSKPVAIDNNDLENNVQRMANVGKVGSNSNDDVKQTLSFQSPSTITRSLYDIQNASSQPVATENIALANYVQKMSTVETVKGNNDDDVKQRLSLQSPSTISSSLCDIQNASSQPKNIASSNQNGPEISNVETLNINKNKPDFNTNSNSANRAKQHDNEPITLEDNTTNNHDNSDNINMISQSNLFQDNQCSQEYRNCLSQNDNDEAQRRSGENYDQNSIFFKDNLLKELLTEKSDIFKSLCKNREKIRNNEEEEVLAKTYIRRYRKGDIRIFKIKRRLKEKLKNQYLPPEEHIMDRFTEKANKDFRDDESLTNVEELESVASSNSYITDVTNVDLPPPSNESENMSEPQFLLQETIDQLNKDPNLLFSRYSESAPKELNSIFILVQIQQIIIGILEDYEKNCTPYFAIPSRVPYNYIYKDERLQLQELPKLQVIHFTNNHTATKFNLMLFVLNKIRLLLETDTKLTKREIFYQLKTIVKDQRRMDDIIHAISWLLKVGPWALNITAQKGLVYGNLKLVMDDAEIINCNVPGTSVPTNVASICEIHSKANFILVVEKDSIFQKLIAEDLPKRLTRPFILITGKGYPDLTTQLFLKKLWMILGVPVFILVDADPDGISIMLNYRFGSRASAPFSEHLAIPKARWIGVFPTDIRKFDLTEQDLNTREIRKIELMLRTECVSKNQKIKEQLEHQLRHGIKAGIEAVQKTETYLSNQYLTTKFYTKDFI